ncbi:MAG: trypsin-like peptidase domain-containing protein [Oscillospiraceae bacterium]|nr:trypsin-like peptidase domain-containing protein [Oscillospiraceae bacterium]
MHRISYDQYQADGMNPPPQDAPAFSFAPVYPFDPEQPVGGARHPRKTPPGRRRSTTRRGGVFLVIAIIAAVVVVIYLLFHAFFPYGIAVRYDDGLDSNGIWTPSATESSAPTTIKRALTSEQAALQIAPLPTGGDLTYQEIYQKNIPSIVCVRASKKGVQSLGSGVICSQNGYIITNAHVISGCSEVLVLLNDGTAADATLAGMDEENDIAVLKIEREDLPAAEFGDANTLTVGEPALAIGNPLGEEFRGTMTAGIISAINRYVSVDGRSMLLIQTTAALNSGNSGGALINSHGQVVGITTLKMWSDSDTIEGIGFAIPSNTVKQIADDLIQNGEVTSTIPSIGIVVATDLEVTRDGHTGLAVVHVVPGSDAEQKGLRAGDVLLTANGAQITSMGDIITAKSQAQAGGTVTFAVWRSGDILTLEIALSVTE